jgi:uncharacterized protein (TIGR02001 family)
MKNIRSFLGAAGVAAVAALGMSTAALADDENKFGYSITISGTSDYIFRGISYTNSDPAFQPFIEFTYGNPNLTWYLDFWGSNIADPFGPFELDMYAGVRPVFGPLAFDLGVLYYTYPNNSIPGSSNGDYVEFKLAATYTTPIKNLSIGATGYFTPDQGSNWGQTETIEGNAAYTLPTLYNFTPVVSGVVGYTHGDDGFSPILGTQGPGDLTGYVYWNAGVKLSIDKYFMDFRYWDTNIDKSDLQASGGIFSNVDQRFVFTAGVNLP